MSVSNYADKTFDVIIHCAYDRSSLGGHENIYDQIKSNISLVEDLCKLKHKCFIFFSSIDVYPSDFEGTTSNFKIGSQELLSKHAFFKILGESIVLSKAKQYLILRPSLMIGKDARANTLVNIIRGYKGPFSLTKSSRFNLITHDQVWCCLNAALATDKRGIMNLCSGLELSLDQVARKVGNKKVLWGNFKYSTPQIKDSNAVKFFNLNDHKISDFISLVQSW